MARLGEVVDDLRGRSFVGRGAEPAGSDDAPAGRSAHRVLFVHGTAGVGLTTLYRGTVFGDTHRLAEIDGDVTGVPYRPDDMRWIGAKALYAAAQRDPAALRGYLAIASFLATPDEVFATRGRRDRVPALGLAPPQYPLPGPVPGRAAGGRRERLIRR